MKRIMTFMAACAIAAPAFAQNAAVVNGQAIPDAQVEEFVKMMTQQGAQDSPKLREQVREELINRIVMVQAAEKADIAKNPEVQTELELARQSVLIRGLFNDFLAKHPVTDAQLKAEYDKIKDSNQQEEYKAAHILVKEEKEAQDIIARLKKGENFAAIAKEKSQDPGSGANGGDLGWASADSYVQPFGEALAKLKKGETTQAPVQSSFGWHVIRLDDTRTAEFPPLEQVKPQLEEMLRQQALAKYQEDLRKAAKVQ
ncbi:peptidylprolyl isomerase [Achromobacter sp. GG226]|uniref:peptidylprolyl isomerase n=1 Tax=Verticiella alkaliphila TaxID=2779529 RepID=UPI001C0BDD94|nr:peptidylprolyl isomerase [Verticiella sp. GG226]MBU4610991.1 peptidylprolyl isomerase [Verticiella sp. GG226]